MNSQEHGDGYFYWYIRGRLDYMTESMKAECRNINNENDFFHFVTSHNCGDFSRNEMLAWFHSMWRFIPQRALYVTYKDLLANTDLGKGRWAHKYFFKPGLRKEIMKLNKHDTVENAELCSMLDEDGFLTVYHGNVHDTVSFSWVTHRNHAITAGDVAALIAERSEYYCATGKVKPKDVISFISGHPVHEITVPPTKVLIQDREVFHDLSLARRKEVALFKGKEADCPSR